MVAPDPPLGPEAILALSADGADDLLDHLERAVPVRPPFVRVSGSPSGPAIVFGDTHGDWPSTKELVARWAGPLGPPTLIGLGDYVDRSPPDCEDGSVANALYLLGVAAAYPDRVYLLQGNHETGRRIPCLPNTLPEEVDDLWGPDATRYERLVGLLERGPLAVATASGAYLAHAGFPRGSLPANWTEAVDPDDEERLLELVWTECTESRSRRGGVPPWGASELARFLGVSGLSLVLRGHDPEITDRPLYDGRALTLQTTRLFERFGGVIVAELPLDTPVNSVRDLRVHHLTTEGRTFD
jgi:hypothetical protein